MVQRYIKSEGIFANINFFFRFLLLFLFLIINHNNQDFDKKNFYFDKYENYILNSIKED